MNFSPPLIFQVGKFFKEVGVGTAEYFFTFSSPLSNCSICAPPKRHRRGRNRMNEECTKKVAAVCKPPHQGDNRRGRNALVYLLHRTPRENFIVQVHGVRGEVAEESEVDSAKTLGRRHLHSEVR